MSRAIVKEANAGSRSAASDSAASASVQLVIFEIDEQLYALRLSAVERVIHAVDITPLPQTPEVIRGIINLRGQIVPVFSLRRRFGLAERAIALTDQFIVGRTRHRVVALVADAVRGVVERPLVDVIEPHRILPDLEQIAGVVRLDDGIALIHDLDRFLSLEEERALELALAHQRDHGF